MNKKIVIGFGVAVLIIFGALFGAVNDDGHSNTVMHAIVSDIVIDSLENIENTEQSASFTKGKGLYTNVYFIESPKGTAYNVRWYRNDEMIYTDTEQMKEDKKGMLVFPLEVKKVIAGSYDVEICMKEYVLFQIEFEVK